VRDPSDIPQIALQPVYSRILRFVNTADVAITRDFISDDMFGAIGQMAVTTSAAHSIAGSFRVKRIQIWASPKSDSDGAWQEAYVDWVNNTSFGSHKRFGDVSISNAKPLHVNTTPPKESVCNLWIQKTGIYYATMRLPPGAVIDVHVNYTMLDQDKVGVLSTIALFYTVGEMFYGKLDQTGGASLIQVSMV
jgi:hypothetical protein